MRLLQDLALLLLGLLAGAMLLIGVAFVGYWRSLDAPAFLDWFAAHADRIGALMIPLGAAATLATLAAAGATWSAGGRARTWSLAAAALAVAVVVVYFAAHAPRNAAFAARETPPPHVATELTAWARWHWIRVILGVAAFSAQLLVVRSAPPWHSRT
jgi:hypothetical protein